MITNKVFENAHKIAFIVKNHDELVKVYPELIDNFPDNMLQRVLSIMAMPSIDINTALWKAAELGLITTPDKETGDIKFLKDPDDWQFGDNLETLMHTITYAFEQLAKTETDLDDVQLAHWLNGYLIHDIFIARQALINNHTLATYLLTDPKDLKSTYTFYTLWENNEQMWGRKAFKTQPTGEEKPDDQNDEA